MGRARRGTVERELCQLLHLSPDAWRQFVDAQTPLEILDARGHTVLVNEAWSTMTGYTAEESGERPRLLPEGSMDADSDLQKALHSGLSWSGSHLAQRRDGSSYPQQSTWIPVMDATNGHRFTIAHHTDLSEAAVDQTMKGLSKNRSTMSQERFRALMDACQDAILISDWMSTRFVDINRAARHLFGYSSAEFDLLCGRDLVDPAYFDAVRDLSHQVRTTGVATSSTLFHRRKDGTGFWGELTLARFGTQFEDGIVAILRNVTARVTHEQTLARTVQDLRERNILFQVAFEDSPVGLAMSASDGLFSSVNPSFCAMLGYTEAEILGRSVRSLTHPADLATEAANARLLISGEIDHYSMEKRFLHKNGNPVYVAMTIARADVAEETIYVAQLIDVSDARQAREQLARASHLAALGRMAAAVAHDVNNPAAYLQLNLAEINRQIASNELGPQDREDILAMLEDCSNGVSRISDIVRELQVFGTDIDTSPRPTDVAEVIRISCRLAAHEVKHHATLKLDLHDVPMVVGQPSKLGRVITNLVLNAARAIGTADPIGHQIRVRCAQEGDHIVVQVSDTGPGLPVDRDDLFEPFVRGGKSRGQGLGLWICAEIVRQHGGNITAHNVSGAGACFTFKLPSANDVLKDTPPGLSLTHHLRVLVIDDEPHMLDAIYRSLRHQHNVTIESDAKTALNRIRAGEPFDVVVCDLMMPMLAGWEFHEQLAAIEPGLADSLVLISGGAIGPVAASFITRSSCILVTKPFFAEDLMLAIDHARVARAQALKSSEKE